MKSFVEKCYIILKKVPRGKVTTYGEIAKSFGNPKSGRAVGNAMNKNPRSFLDGGNIPCHRVVKSNGEIGGFASGSKKKISMLKKEGVVIINGKIDLKRFGFRFS